MSNLKPPDPSPARTNVTNTEPGQSTTPANGEDVFDPARLRLSQNFTDALGVKKALLTVPVRKPNRQEFVRVHPGEEYRISVAVIELKDERETYLIDPAVYPEIPGHVVPKQLLTTINRQGVLALWPIRLPGEDGRLDEWNRSAQQAADMAMKDWVRVAANMSLGAYEVFQATGDLPEPEWPDVTFRTILRTAFKDHFIRSLDHPVIHRLRGAI
jgi:hypothetical protein